MNVLLFPLCYPVMPILPCGPSSSCRLKTPALSPSVIPAYKRPDTIITNDRRPTVQTYPKY